MIIGHPVISSLVLKELISDPNNPYQGQTYVNAITSEIKTYFGLTWQVLHTLIPADSLLTEEGELLLQESGFKTYLDQ